MIDVAKDNDFFNTYFYYCFFVVFPGEEDDDVEVKQTYISQYESMHITAIVQPYKQLEEHCERGE
jgi:hypothetical protein